MWLITGLTIWRILYLWVVPLDLIADEAYYWDWSRQLDIGYYSKPPMIAWVNFVSRSLLWHDAFCVRLPAPLLNAAAMSVVYVLAKTMYDSRVALWALLFMAASPGAVLLNLVMTIDAPLVLFWSVGLYAGWRALNAEGCDWRWWCLSGVAGGLGLLTKQMMLAYLGGLFLVAWIVPDWRRHLRTPGPYVMLVIAIVVFSPVIFWNAQNDWITAEHTTHHFHASKRPWYNGFSTFGEYVGGQFGVVSPITGILGLLVILQAAKFAKRSRDPRAVFLLVLGPLGLLGIALLSFRQRINANWPAVFHVASVLLLAAWAGGGLRFNERFAGLRAWRIPALGLGDGLAVILYLLPFVWILLGLDGGKLDPARRLRGWEKFGATLSEIKAEFPQPENTVVVAFNRKHTAELAYYMLERPTTYEWRADPNSIRNQYTLWGGPVDRIGADAMLVVPYDRKPPPEIVKHFRAIHKVAELHIRAGGDGQHHVTIYRGEHILSWPTRDK